MPNARRNSVSGTHSRRCAQKVTDSENRFSGATRHRRAYALLFAFLCVHAAASGADALAPTGDAVEVALADMAILLPAAPTPQEVKAAAELQYHLAAVVGRPPEIRQDFAPSRPDAPPRFREPVISVGDTALARARAPFPDADLGREGYVIAVADGNVYLAGGSRRGPLNAAYALLEEDLGVRWYSAWWPPHYRRTGLASARVTPRASTPAFPVLRDVCDYQQRDMDYVLRNRLSPFRPTQSVPLELGGTCHAAGDWRWHTYDFFLRWNPEPVFAEHPEWFMMDEKGGRSTDQLCPTNPGLQRAFADRAIEVLREDGQGPGTILGVSQRDTPVFCVCPTCAAVNEREGTDTAASLELVNFVAREVKRAGLDATITFLGYQRTLDPPRHMKMEDNTALFLCTDCHMLLLQHRPVRCHAGFARRLEQWKRIVPAVHIWDYHVNYANYHAAMPSLFAASDNLRYFRDEGVTGVFFQNNHEGRGADRQEMRAWVLAKLFWDPDRDVRALMDDFIEGAYGAAAPLVKAWNDEIFAWGEADLPGPPDKPAFIARSLAAADAMRDALVRAGEEHLLDRVDLLRLSTMIQKMDDEFAPLLAKGEGYTPAYRALVDEVEALAGRLGVWTWGEGTNLAARLARIRGLERVDVGPRAETVTRDGRDYTLVRPGAVWRFKFLGNLLADPAGLDDAAREGAQPGVDDAGWDRYLDNLNCGWEEQGYPFADGTGIFRQRVTVENPAARAYWYLVFPGVDEQGTLYVNGAFVAEQTTASTGLTPKDMWNYPLVADVTGKLAAGENLVALVCRDELGMGGMYLPVYLVGSDTALRPAEARALVPVANPWGESREFGRDG